MPSQASARILGARSDTAVGKLQRPGGYVTARVRDRQRRKPIPRARTRQLALAVAYPAQQPSTKQLIQLYLNDGGRQDGAETFAMVIRQDWRLARLRGPGAATTGPRRALGLAIEGRPRVRRTIQRHRQHAAKLGIAVYQHVKLGKGTPGNRDYLRVFLLTPPRCHPAFGSSYRALRPYIAASAAASGCEIALPRGSGDRAPPKAASEPPPSAARHHPAAKRRGTTSSERGEGAKPDQLTLLCENCQSPLELVCDTPIWEGDCETCGLLVALPPNHPLRRKPVINEHSANPLDDT